MKLKELIEKLIEIRDSIPNYYDDAEIRIYNAQRCYCEISGVSTDGKDRIYIIEDTPYYEG